MLWLRVNDARDVLRAATAVTVAGAGLGVSLIGSGGTAFADSGDTGAIGFSPGREVVQFAPYAVSVTFDTALSDSGASMSIMTKDGEVGEGEISTSAKTLRRSVLLGAPNGVYTVDWAAVSEGGEKFSGTFSFTAGHPNDDPLITGVPAPEVSATPSVTPEVTPEASESPSVAPSPSETKSPWVRDGEAAGFVVPTDEEPPAGGGSSYGFPLQAIALGSLLVLASALISRFHRSGVPERLTIRTSRGVYSV